MMKLAVSGGRVDRAVRARLGCLHASTKRWRWETAVGSIRAKCGLAYRFVAVTPATIEAKAVKLERAAEAIEARLPKSALLVPAVSGQDAFDLSPDDPRWGRSAIEALRASAHHLREFGTR